jgi:hypothetical protein
MTMLARITNILTTHGESFFINGMTSAVGFFRVLDSSTMHVYLDDTEVMTVARPGLCLVVPADTEIELDDIINRDDRDYTVRKIGIERFAGTPMVKVVILS